MFFDEEIPNKKPAKPKDLESMSVDELQAYISDLKDEIARAEAEIVRKEKHKSDAASFFKS
tara:strand:- start:242 stop:424 length:183 start_codon:yes stop_codon:yes gene_type:complete